jgi:energy-coupling factor transporter ATP-binding protein EcfA2
VPLTRRTAITRAPSGEQCPARESGRLSAVETGPWIPPVGGLYSGLPWSTNTNVAHMPATTADVDRSAFEITVDNSLSDGRVRSYFDRGLVGRAQVQELVGKSDAYEKAIRTEAYSAFDSLRADIAKRSKQRSRIFNGWTLCMLLIFTASALTLFPQMFSRNANAGLAVWILVLLSIISGGIFGKLATQLVRKEHPSRATVLVPLSLLLLSLLVASLIQLFVQPWDTAATVLSLVAICVATAIFIYVEAPDYLREALSQPSKVTGQLFDASRLAALRDQWLKAATEDVIIPNMVLAINTLLGNEYDKLLVEQDSVGLRKLQDPTFRVSTRTKYQLDSLLSQMDGGSVAVSGPRGAGKSTLLKQLTEPGNHDIRNTRGMSVYVSAPSNYVARDFIADLFQQLCEGYLRYCGYPVGEQLYSVGKSKASGRRSSRNVLMISWLSLRALAAIAFIGWAAWIFTQKLSSATPVGLRFIDSWNDRAPTAIRDFWDSHWPYFALGILVLALAFWPRPSTWRRYMWRRAEPELINRAREYLLRLQVDKTVTQNASITLPVLRGIGFGLDRGASAKYTPWTLPELVGYTRRFMSDVARSESIASASRPVMIAIDEIDRIGTLEQAEAFIGDIKAVFGVEKCYFVVSVAEDVGSLFAQRATAGRSILENAFDEVVTAGPLEFEEARNLLVKRVPGFINAFVYLVYALSGGLPRELIRVTRRLIEINLGQASAEYYPRLADLTLDLVREEVIEALDAARNQLSRLDLPPEWAWYFDTIRSASAGLRQIPPASRDTAPGAGFRGSLYDIVGRISTLSEPKHREWADQARLATENDQVAALGVVSRLSAFAYFGMTVIDAFSDTYFDLDQVSQNTTNPGDGSYEQLAVARIELSIFAASATAILERFRAAIIGLGQ